MDHQRVLRSMLWLVLLPFFTAVSMAQSSGVISGTVVDQTTTIPLPGAEVKIQGSALSTDTDRVGKFQLLRVPAGRQSINISYLGYEVGAFEVEVRPGETVNLPATLKPLAQIREYVEVHVDPQTDGQARALNQQKTSPNIVNIVSADQIGRFPDPNAAEATQRINVPQLHQELLENSGFG